MGKTDGETDAGIQQYIVVAVVSEITSKDGSVQTQLAKERARKTDLIEIRSAWPYRKPQYGAVQTLSGGRAGKQQIFDRGRLECTVIGSVQQQLQRREVARNPEPWTPGRCLRCQAVMIEANSSAQVPVARVK